MSKPTEEKALGELLRQALEAEPEGFGVDAELSPRTMIDGHFDLTAVARRFVETARALPPVDGLREALKKILGIVACMGNKTPSDSTREMFLEELLAKVQSVAAVALKRPTGK